MDNMESKQVAELQHPQSAETLLHPAAAASFIDLLPAYSSKKQNIIILTMLSASLFSNLEGWDLQGQFWLLVLFSGNMNTEETPQWVFFPLQSTVVEVVVAMTVIPSHATLAKTCSSCTICKTER